MKRKILSMIMVLCIGMMLLPTFASAAELTVGAGGTYPNLSNALVAAENGDTIKLLNAITESVTYTVIAGKTITIDGGNHTLTCPDGASSVGLTLLGEGTINLKNISLQGGIATDVDSAGLNVSGSVNVQSIGTVNSTGGTAESYVNGNSYGVYHAGTGTVNITNATGGTSNKNSFGVWSNSSGTVNVINANGGSAPNNVSAGVDCTLGFTGTVNVTNATGGTNARYNSGLTCYGGIINVTNATGNAGSLSSYGVCNYGGKVNVYNAIANAGSPTSHGVFCANAGAVTNVVTSTGSTSGILFSASGIVNTAANVTTLTLNKGVGASCVLDSITVASAGNTTVGVLPAVTKNGVIGQWFTDSAKTAGSEFSGTTVTGTTTLYSTFYEVSYAVSATTNVVGANGVTATASYGASPYVAGASASVTITLSGTAAASGTHTLGLTSSADAGAITAPATVTKTVTAGATPTDTYVFTFTMPAKIVDDLVVTHTFVQASTAPTAGVTTVAKTAETQAAVDFTLNSALAGTWKVYNAQTDGSIVADVTASTVGTTLTLTHATNIPASTYYVSVTETGKSESTRLALTVGAYVAPTYTMTAIADQTLTGVTAGYGAGTQETKALTITRTGTGDLASVGTALSGANAGSFTITQPAVTTLNNGTPNTTFTVKANDGLAVGTYTAIVTVSATNMTNETFTVTQVVNVAPTYTMTAIADQTLTAVTAGYGVGTQETKTLTITRTGTGDLASVATALSGANAGSFTITQPAVTTLNNGTPNTTFTVKANDGLAVGTYTATVTVSATNMTNETFTVTQVVNAATSGGSSGGDSSSTPVAKILEDIKTQDEQKLEKSLQQTGEARIELASTGSGQANITGNILGQLFQLDKPLNIAGQGVSLQFAPDSLQTSQITGQNNNATVQIGAAAVTDQEQEAILAATPLGQSTGVFQVGGQVFNFTAQRSTTSGGSTSTESITSFAEPVAVTIDLSGLSLTSEQISQLTGTRLEKNEQGEIVPVFLGGTYDSVNKTFTFYTDKFSIYTVLQKNGIVILNLTIGNTTTKLNGGVKTIDVPPSLINNRTFVPLRFIGEALGATFDWNDKTKTVTFQCGAEELALTVGTTIPGMDTPPTIVSGRTMVPLRYISETFGAQVMWFPASRSVSVVK